MKPPRTSRCKAAALFFGNTQLFAASICQMLSVVVHVKPGLYSGRRQGQRIPKESNYPERNEIMPQEPYQSAEFGSAWSAFVGVCLQVPKLGFGACQIFLYISVSRLFEDRTSFGAQPRCHCPYLCVCHLLSHSAVTSNVCFLAVCAKLHS